MVVEEKMTDPIVINPFAYLRKDYQIIILMFIFTVFGIRYIYGKEWNKRRTR